MRKFFLASAATFVSAGAALAQPVTAPAPGNVVVNLHGQFQYTMGLTNSVTNGATKVGGVSDFGFLRLYPGFDATTSGGLQYGVASELRTIPTTAPGPGAGTATTSSTLYIRRAYGYAGSAHTGFLRFGQGDSAFTLLQDGVFESFGDGQQWNSDGSVGAYAPGVVGGAITNLMPGQFIYADTSRLYATNKIVYLSPSYAGFNFGVSYEPNSNGLYQDGVDADDISIAASSSARRRNTFDGMVQYVGTFSGVGIRASAGELVGSPLGNTEAAATPSYYKQLEVTQAGAQISYAGFTVGGNVKYGQVNNSYTMLAPGQRKGLTYIAGATYTLGPVILGSTVFHAIDAGAIGDSHMYNSTGVAAGVTYTINPNLATWVQYLYGQEHQLGLGATSQIGNDGNAHQNAISVGAALKW